MSTFMELHVSPNMSSFICKDTGESLFMHTASSACPAWLVLLFLIVFCFLHIKFSFFKRFVLFIRKNYRETDTEISPI